MGNYLQSENPKDISFTNILWAGNESLSLPFSWSINFEIAQKLRYFLALRALRTSSIEFELNLLYSVCSWKGADYWKVKKSKKNLNSLVLSIKVLLKRFSACTVQTWHLFWASFSGFWRLFWQNIQWLLPVFRSKMLSFWGKLFSQVFQDIHPWESVFVMESLLEITQTSSETPHAWMLLFPHSIPVGASMIISNQIHTQSLHIHLTTSVIEARSWGIWQGKFSWYLFEAIKYYLIYFNTNICSWYIQRIWKAWMIFFGM